MTAQKILKKLGYNQFQPGQADAVKALICDQSVLAIMPTGGGKSLIYQVAAEMVDGLTLVISPLIALMTDQVAAAKANGQTAAVVNSQLSAAAIQVELDQAAAGDTTILYVSPERLQNEQFVSWLHAQKLGLVVIDEAHCISEWGHDFRPAYTAIGKTLQELGQPLTLALTATATAYVADDIIGQLGLHKPLIVRRGTDRPNLYYDVIPVSQEADKATMLLELLTGGYPYPSEVASEATAAYQTSGIVYTATTAAAEEISRWLNETGIAAGYYHGQQKKADREQAQAGFMDGTLRIIAATNAFGMGIDKQDVGFVVHYDVPPNIESYYQEAGRAGRGGQFAICSLLYRPEDMDKAGFGSGSSDERRKQYEQGRRQMMRSYAEKHDCRRESLLHYYGESYTGPCGRCDADLTRAEAVHTVDSTENTDHDLPFTQGDNVVHDEWGTGTVQSAGEGVITVLFETVGHKVLDAELAVGNNLLAKA